MIHLILGPDRYLARNVVRELTARLDPSGEHTTWIDGREATVGRVAGAIGTVPFFGGAPVVVVSDFLSHSGRESEGGGVISEEGSQRRNDPALAALLTNVPSAHALIFFEPALSTAPSAFRTAAPGAEIVTNEPPRGAALIGWITEAARGAGSEIDRRTAQLLAERLFPQTWDRKPNNPRYDRPPDLAFLTHEIEKLALAEHPNAIGPETVARLTSGGPDQRLFRFLDAALAGDVRTAMVEMDRLIAAGEEPAMVLAQLLGQVEIAAVTAAAAGRDANSVARDLGSIAAARISAVTASSRRMPKREIALAILATAVDRNLKTGHTRTPVDALHDALLALAST